MNSPFKAQSRAELEARYGQLIRNDVDKILWPNETHWMDLVDLPGCAAQIINTVTNKPWTRVYVNIDVIKPLIDTIELLQVKGILSEIKTFDGCYMPRDIRGVPGVYSLHSYAIALDFNAKDMPLGSASLWSDEFVNTWIQMGWTWGGNFKRKDPQHFEWFAEG